MSEGKGLALPRWFIEITDKTTELPHWYEDLIHEADKLQNQEVIETIQEMEQLEGNENEEKLKEIEEKIKQLDIPDSIEKLIVRRHRILKSRVERAISDNFGSLIKHKREEKGYSLNKLQELTGISPSYINRIEKGERKAPSLKIIEKLADALDADLSELLSVANRENGDVELVSLEELILSYNFTINGQVASKSLKENIVSFITKLNEVEWSSETKYKDSIELMEYIDRYKNLISK